MFTDLRQWDDAKKFAQAAEKMNIMDLIRRQAQWAEEARDWKAAAEMYRESGDMVKAVEIFGERGWLEELMELCKVISFFFHSIIFFANLFFIRYLPKQSMWRSKKQLDTSVKLDIQNMPLRYLT